MNFLNPNALFRSIIALVVVLAWHLILCEPARAGNFLLTPPSGTLHYHRDIYGQVSPVVFPDWDIPKNWTWAQDLSLNRFNSQALIIEIPFIPNNDDSSSFPPDDPSTPVSDWELY